MKKLLYLLVSLALMLSVFSGCDRTPAAPSGDSHSPLALKKDGVVSVGVSSLPTSNTYSFEGENAQAIVDYLLGLNLTSDFSENPSEYNGRTWEVSVEYDNGNTVKVYHFGNMFIRTGSDSWYKMNYEEASRFDSLLYELSDPIGFQFPPKDITLTMEGMPYVVHHEAIGQEAEGGVPGFAMYIDTERYYGIEENGAYYVRPITIEYDREEIRRQQSALIKDLSPAEQEAYIDKHIEELKEFYASLPPVEIEIRHITDQDYQTYAEQTRAQMVGSWVRVDELQWFDASNKLYYFHIAGEVKWDAPHESHRFIDDGKGGTFHIVSRCYLEAAEGAGYRFDVMIGTFTVLDK